jgi:UDP-N-acetylmuramoyl-L-alanyl-D-glutamate--2,6-diaminopimelate ligase
MALAPDLSLYTQVVPGRFEVIDEGQEFVVLVDYARTPDTLNGLLDAVRECEDCKRIILVVGCAGDDDASIRPYIGEIAHYKADVVILTNDNPRTEAPEEIIEGIVEGFPEEIVDAYPETTYDFLVDVGRVPPVRFDAEPRPLIPCYQA